MIENYNIRIDNLFVFTDDYSKIEDIEKIHPEWNIYTLASQSDCGYNNREFQNSSWDYKRKKLIRLFAMVEICIDSDIHFGYEQSCVNNIIKPAKGKNYCPLMDLITVAKLSRKNNKSYHE